MGFLCSLAAKPVYVRMHAVWRLSLLPHSKAVGIRRLQRSLPGISSKGRQRGRGGFHSIVSWWGFSSATALSAWGWDSWGLVLRGEEGLGGPPAAGPVGTSSRNVSHQQPPPAVPAKLGMASVCWGRHLVAPHVTKPRRSRAKPQAESPSLPRGMLSLLVHGHPSMIESRSLSQALGQQRGTVGRGCSAPAAGDCPHSPVHPAEIQLHGPEHGLCPSAPSPAAPTHSRIRLCRGNPACSWGWTEAQGMGSSKATPPFYMGLVLPFPVLTLWILAQVSICCCFAAAKHPPWGHVGTAAITELPALPCPAHGLRRHTPG